MKRIEPHELKWVGIDLDKTVCKTEYPTFDLGEPLPHVHGAFEKLQDNGYKIVIYTARPWSEYMNIEEWFNEHSIPFDKIECGKLLVRMLIDDRAYRFDGWENVDTMLETLR